MKFFVTAVVLSTFFCCSGLQPSRGWTREHPPPALTNWKEEKEETVTWKLPPCYLSDSLPAETSRATQAWSALPAWQHLLPTTRSASRSVSEGLWEWRMLQSWRRASIDIYISLWWKIETLQLPGTITLPWLTLWGITWLGGGSEHSSFTMKQTQR